MDSKITTVLKGGSFPFTFDRDGASISGWTCTISVQQYPGDTPAVNRVITADDLEWPGFLTGTETTALPILGTWMVIASINNASDDKTEYQTVRFHLAEGV